MFAWIYCSDPQVVIQRPLPEPVGDNTPGSALRVGNLREAPLITYRTTGESFSARWPDEVARSDLKLDKWIVLVEEYNVGADAEEVLSGCENRFHQGIPPHTLGPLKRFTPTNHESAKLAEGKIMNTLEKEKRALRIFSPFTHKEVYEKIGFFQSNPMGSVINGDGPFRIINDISFPHNKPDTPSVNSFVDKK